MGLIPGASYLSEKVRCAAGDVFMVLSDGLIETINHEEEEFGLQRLEHLFLHQACEPLSVIFENLISAISHYETQQDDRTILLVRIVSVARPDSQLLRI